MQVNSYRELNKMFNYFGIDQNHDFQDLRIVMIFSEPGFSRNLLGEPAFFELFKWTKFKYFDYHPGNPLIPKITVQNQSNPKYSFWCTSTEPEILS